MIMYALNWTRPKFNHIKRIFDKKWNHCSAHCIFHCIPKWQTIAQEDTNIPRYKSTYNIQRSNSSYLRPLCVPYWPLYAGLGGLAELGPVTQRIWPLPKVINCPPKSDLNTSGSNHNPIPNLNPMWEQCPYDTGNKCPYDTGDKCPYWYNLPDASVFL